MSRRRPRPNAVRGWTQEEAGAYVGVSETWFINNRARLRAAGFPEPSALTGRYDAKLVARWYDAHSGIDAAQKTADDPWGQGLTDLEAEIAGRPN